MTTDNMSNEEVIEVLKGIVFNSFDRTTRKERQALDFAIKALEERPQGEWIEVGDNQPYSKDKLYGCSKCGFGGYLLSDTKNVNFCPNCGADMREVEK